MTIKQKLHLVFLLTLLMATEPLSHRKRDIVHEMMADLLKGLIGEDLTPSDPNGISF